MTQRSYAAHWVRPEAPGDRRTDRPALSWPDRFLRELAQSGDELAACRAAGVPRRAALELRWSTRSFAVAWDCAVSQARDRRWARVLAVVLETSSAS
jgi:hypothetical protein